MLTIGFNPELFHIFGPFSLHAYGIFIALGIFAFIALTFNHPIRKKYLTAALYEKLLFFTVIIALFGARIMHIISEWHTYHSLSEALSIWNGGLSVLGALMASLLFIPLFLRAYAIPVLPIFDLTAQYIPLTQAIARLGCLFAGCCFGCQTHAPWAITYTHIGSHAPLHLALHPTQLYSSLIFLTIFILLQLISRTVSLRPGQLAALYIIFSSFERFMVDFFRGDRIINSDTALIQSSWLSMHQWISLGLMAVGVILFVATYFNKRFNNCA